MPADGAARRAAGGAIEDGASDFPARLRRAMHLRGLTHCRLAEATAGDLSAEALSRWTRGEREPGTTALRRLAMALDVSADWLLGLDAPDPFDDEAAKRPGGNPLRRRDLTAVAVHLERAAVALRDLAASPVATKVPPPPAPASPVPPPPSPTTDDTPASRLESLRARARERTEPLLNKRQAAEHLGMSTRWVEQQQRDHGLPFRRCGGTCLYYASEINEWVERRRAAGPEGRNPPTKS